MRLLLLLLPLRFCGSTTCARLLALRSTQPVHHRSNLETCIHREGKILAWCHFSLCVLLWPLMHMHGGHYILPQFFLFFWTPSLVVTAHGTQLYMLSHVRGWARFENGCPKFGVLPPKRKSPQNANFRAVLRRHLVLRRKRTTDKRKTDQSINHLIYSPKQLHK